jgi:hypothetical protein
LLPLNYSTDVPVRLIEELERHGKRLGVSLTALERIGQDLALAEGFILASEAGRGMDFARAVEFGENLARFLEPAGPLGSDLGVVA